MPDKFLRPQPALFPHGEDEFQNIRVPLAADDALLDIQNERSRRFQHPEQFLRDGQKPFDVLVGMDAAVRFLSLVGIGRRGENQIDRVAFQVFQLLAAVAVNDCRRLHRFSLKSVLTDSTTNVFPGERAAGLFLTLRGAGGTIPACL